MPPADRLIDLACPIKQSSYKIIATSTYTISSSKVPISLLNLSRYTSLANIFLSKASLHLGARSYQSKGFISRGCNWVFITTISMEAFPLYKPIGPTAANFFQEHITHQFGTHTKLQATNGDLSIEVLLYQVVAIPCTLFKVVVVP